MLASCLNNDQQLLFIRSFPHHPSKPDYLIWRNTCGSIWNLPHSGQNQFFKTRCQTTSIDFRFCRKNKLGKIWMKFDVKAIVKKLSFWNLLSPGGDQHRDQQERWQRHPLRDRAGHHGHPVGERPSSSGCQHPRKVKRQCPNSIVKKITGVKSFFQLWLISTLTCLARGGMV